MNSLSGSLALTDSHVTAALWQPAIVGQIAHPVSDLSTDRLIEQMLYALEPHSLDSLHNAALMSRVDSKFLLPKALVVDVLISMAEEYSILEINGLRSFNYVTTYYDTPLHTHYLAHHNGRLNRFKVRKRTYVESRSSYLEVKFKDNRGRTTKTRMRSGSQHFELDNEAIGFLAGCAVPDPVSLEPVQTGGYRRIALANEARGERLTIDLDLNFRDERDGKQHDLGPWAIVELKQNLMNRDSAFFFWASRHGVRQLSFSKYCMGVYFTGAQHLKRNNFHPIARQLRH